jgi:carbon storage regulator
MRQDVPPLANRRVTSVVSCSGQTQIKEERIVLVLSRKPGEQIIIGGRVTVTINRLHGNRVSLAIDAPADVKILRGELRRMELDESSEPGRSVRPVLSRLPAHLLRLPGDEMADTASSLPTLPR